MAVARATVPRRSSRRQALACTVCGERDPDVLRQASDVAHDRKSATDGHDALSDRDPVAVYSCISCRSLFRDPDGPPADAEERSRRDASDDAALDQLRQRGLEDLRHDRRWFGAHGVRMGKRVLEIGCSAGAFLEFAAEEGSDAIAVDADPRVAEFCTDRGLDVRTGPLSANRLGMAFDSVWIVSCFEQLPDPDAVLREIGLVLRPEGTLVIRTPSAEFVRLAHESRVAPVLQGIADANGLLGVPFERVYAAPALVRLLRHHGFEVSRMRGREQTSLVPRGRSPLWALHRPARLALYAAASAPTRRRLYPWLDVVARLEG